MRYAGRVLGVLGLVAGCAATGCAARFPPVPGNGGPTWLELTTEHFTVWTDADPPRAHEIAQVLEQVHQVVVGVAFPDASRGRILVFAVRNDEELKLVQPQGRAFARVAKAPLFQPIIVLSTISDDLYVDQTIMHELSHVISFAVIHHQPRWFAEGLAQYFQTMQFRVGKTIVHVGVAPTPHTKSKRMPALLPISTLFAWELRDERAEDQLYSTAWALFTFLINEHRAELMHFMHLLDEAGRGSMSQVATQSEQMWNQAFPSLPLTGVDGELRRWLVSGRHLVLRFRVQPHEWRVRERALSDAEVHAIQGFLIADEKQEQRSTAAALALDPTNVLARLFDLYHRNIKISAATGRAMAAAHGDDWRAWWLAALALAEDSGETPEAVAAATRACSLIAENPALFPPPKLCPADGASRPAGWWK